MRGDCHRALTSDLTKTSHLAKTSHADQNLLLDSFNALKPGGQVVLQILNTLQTNMQAE